MVYLQLLTTGTKNYTRHSTILGLKGGKLQKIMILWYQDLWKIGADWLRIRTVTCIAKAGDLIDNSNCECGRCCMGQSNGLELQILQRLQAVIF